MSVPFHHIHTFPNGNNLYLGSQSAVGGWPDKWNYTEKDHEDARKVLKDHGIRYVVCCAELYDAWKEDIEFLHIPMEWDRNFDISSSCLTAWSWMTEKLNHGSILVHCSAGCHRSAAVVIGYLAKTQTISIQQSYEHVKEIRRCVHLDDNFAGQLSLLM
jgi:hypothetical protein